MENKELELRKIFSEELSSCKKQGDDAEFHMLQHVIDYSKMAIKGSFILNGTASVSVLTLFTMNSLQQTSPYIQLLEAITIFCYGTFFSLICIISAYITQTFYQNETAYSNALAYINLQRQHLFYIASLFSETKTLKKDIDNIENNINSHNNKIKQFTKWGKIFHFISICILIASLCCFYLGVNSVKDGFEKQMLTNSAKETINVIKK